MGEGPLYLGYFGLPEAPFSVTPDPRFFYANSLYQEAYAALQYGIKNKKGFIVVTGEVGTGKTTLLRKLMRSLEATIDSVFIFNTYINFPELLQLILQDLGLGHKGKTRLMMIQELNEYLMQQLRKRRTVSVLIDEAQNLNDKTLEGLRLLSNLETDREKLLQIVLLGQPELETKLDQPQMRQLKQRVALWCRLTRLRDEEVGCYIDLRLRAAGYKGHDLFAPDAVREIALFSKGVPRLINIICDNALLTAYAGSQKRVSAPIIREAARDLRLEQGAQAAKAAVPPAKARATDMECIPRRFFHRVTDALAEAMGPLAPIVVRDQVTALGESMAAFPKERLKELLGAVSREILDDTLKAGFLKQMREQIRLLQVIPRSGSPKVFQPVAARPMQSQPRHSVRVALAVSVFILFMFTGTVALVIETYDYPWALPLTLEPIREFLGDTRRFLHRRFSAEEAETEDSRLSLGPQPSVKQGPEPQSSHPGIEPPAAAGQRLPASSGDPYTGESPGEQQGSSTVHSHPPPVQRKVTDNGKDRPVEIGHGSAIREILGDADAANKILATDLLREFDNHIQDMDWVRAGRNLWLPPLSPETLLRKQPDGSYRLIVASFPSYMGAERFSEALRYKGYAVMVTARMVSDNFVAHRVEIEELKSLKDVNQAWNTAQAHTGDFPGR